MEAENSERSRVGAEGGLACDVGGDGDVRVNGLTTDARCDNVGGNGERKNNTDNSRLGNNNHGAAYTNTNIIINNENNINTNYGMVEETRERRESAAWWHEGRRDALAFVEQLASMNPAQTAAASEEGNARGAIGGRTAFSAETSAHEHERRHEAEMHVAAAVEPVESGANYRNMEEPHGKGSTVAVPAGALGGRQKGCGEEGDGRCEKRSMLHVVLVDDNMHFRSMRHEILRLAREREGVIVLPAYVSTCTALY